MERLSFVDQVLHKLGSSGMPALYMQGAMVVDPSTCSHKITPAILAQHIAARLSKFPVLRKKLVQDRLKIGDMRLVEDSKFDPLYHIDFATLPAPGDRDTLYRHIAAFSVEPLDFRHPPWRFEIIDGLEGGKFAIVQKLSHATMDGMMALKVTQSLFDDSPTAPSRYNRQTSWPLALEPAPRELFHEALKENWQRFGIHTPRTLLSLSKRAAVNWSNRRQSLKSKPQKLSYVKPHTTSINGAISTDKRSLGAAIFELDQLKIIAKALDVKLNDICLLMTSEALRQYFRKIGEKIDFDLILVMPMSIREAADQRPGNVLTLTTINAHNTITNLEKRLRAISKDTRAAKASRATAGETIMDISEILSPLLIDALAMALKRLSPWQLLPTPANAVMTNLAGPSQPLYFAGMPIEYQIPLIPVFHKAALSIGATSMANTFSIGVHACGDVVKQENIHFLIDALYSTYSALEDIAKKRIATRTRPRAAVAVIQPKKDTATPPKKGPKKLNPVSP